MTQSSKMLWVFPIILGLLAYSGSTTVLMASHATHFVSDKGPQLPQNEGGCTACHAAGNLQCGENGPFFNSGTDSDGDDKFNLSETDVCDPCHSQGGVYDGVDHPVFGAKANWDTGVYEPDGTTLKDGKEKWCATCHDDDPAHSKADGETGVDAPNVAGDSSQVYGYYVSGHGRQSADVECEGCHDLTGSHIDHEPRTYDASTYPDSNYGDGYRLNDRLDVPRHANLEGQFLLCTQCHSDWFGPLSNFRYDKSTEIVYLHQEHLGMYSDDLWDSDSDYTDLGGVPKQYTFNWDSAISCPTCHNVHGSAMDVNGELKPCPVMIRRGELTGLAPAYDFHWHTQTNATGPATNVLSESRSGKMRVGLAPYYQGCKNLGCHDNWAYYNRDVSILIDDFESYSIDENLRNNWLSSQDAKEPFLDTSGGPDESKCMRVRVKWTRSTYNYGTVKRLYDPYIDLRAMNSISFYVRVMKTAKIKKIKVKLVKYPEGTVCNAVRLTSDLEDGVWKEVSFLRADFDDATWGKVSQLKLHMVEYNPGQDYVQDVYFDDIRFTP